MYSGLIMSNAMSGMVGLFVICLFIVFFYIFRCIKFRSIWYNFFRHILLLFSCLVLSILFVCSHKSLIFDDIVSFSHQTSEIVNGNISDSYGSFRIFIWRNTLKVVPKYLVHGVGIDNFYNAFDEPLFLKFGDNYIEYYDKAHNEYLEKLVCEGIFSCLTYIIMLFVIFIKSFKYIIRCDDYVVSALFFAFIGYCVQAFFNISVIHMAPLFYIVCGLLCCMEDVFE
jgi:putative inorganic carbon (HCO3(-)) transporter